MKVGLVDVDGHNFPNTAIMKIAGYHKAKGDDVDWAFHFDHYDRIYKSKVFTFTPDDNTADDADEIIKGGTGYDITSRLPEEIEAWTKPDYSIYGFPFSIQFYSRGCIRRCPFCLVHDKEGDIHPVEPMALNPVGKWIEVLDNNFFANPEWREAIRHLKAQGQPVNFHGVDIRIMDREQTEALKGIRLKRNIHIAWDLPQLDLTDKLKEVVKIIPARRLLRPRRLQLDTRTRPSPRPNAQEPRHHSLRAAVPRLREQDTAFPVRQGLRTLGQPSVDTQVLRLHGLRASQWLQMFAIL